MKSITINGSKRESVGKSSTKALRNAGKVPCVVYGGEKPEHFSADEISFSKLVYTPNAHTVIISMDNKSEINAVIQDIQFHPVTEKILHVDFLQIFEDKEVIGEITIVIKGINKTSEVEYNSVELKKDIDELLNAGLSLSAASKYLSKRTGIQKSIIYNLN